MNAHKQDLGRTDPAMGQTHAGEDLSWILDYIMNNTFF